MSWCSECGGEHRAGVAACVFCGGTLVDVQPAPHDDAQDHEVATVDIGSLDGSQRSVLRLLMTSDGLHAQVAGDRVRVVAADVAAVEELVQGLLDAEELAVDEPVEWSGPSAEEDGPPSGPTVDGRPVVGTGTRLGAWIVDWLIVGVATTLVGVIASWLGGHGMVDGWWIAAAVWLIEVALVARFGWTPGKLVVGLRVIGPEGLPPGWRRAAVRSAVMIGPMYVMSAVSLVWPVLEGALTLGASLWLPLLLWTVATGSSHQGWHDRAAGTYVVER